jgi:ATP-dependent HslUV protease ATP-binding subunit HslU
MWRSTLRACLFSRGSLTAAKPRQTHCRKQLTDRNRAQIIFGLNLISNAYAQNPLSMLPPLFTPSRSYSGLATVEEAPSIPTLEIKNVQTELDELVPLEIVKELDKHIVGQEEAKRAVAIAMRNRWRRQRVPKELRDEIIPKNILMIGPTGCGKTEVARRMAKLINAPFVKVEATKYTEVGFRGKDVDSIISDLLEVAIVQQRELEFKRARPKIQQIVEERLLDLAIGSDTDTSAKTREEFRQLLRAGKLEDVKVEYEVPEVRPQGFGMGLMRYDPDEGTFANIFRPVFVSSNSSRKKLLPIREVRPLMEEEELEKLTKKDSIIKNAIYACEQNGIVFIDEIDKIVGDKDPYHADASAEGVQRDLLPIIEGSHPPLSNPRPLSFVVYSYRSHSLCRSFPGHVLTGLWLCHVTASRNGG